MRKHRYGLAGLAVGLLVAAVAGSAWAGDRAPLVDDARLTQVWGSIYKLSLTATARRGAITAAEYRAGPETGVLYAADGMLDSPVEEVQSYVDLGDSTALTVRVQGGGLWSEWTPVPSPSAGGLSQARCTARSTAGGSGEWFRGPVTVDCSGLVAADGAEYIEYSLGFSDWLPATDWFSIDAEGVHWVQVRTMGQDGTPGLPQTFRIAIDGTAPRLWLAPLPTTVLTHADQLQLEFAADDDLSGVGLVAADLNGEHELAAGAPVDLWRLPLGEHVLSVFARDQAGNMAQLTDPAVLTITVDAPALGRLVQSFAGRGRLDSYTGLRQRLLQSLEAAEKARRAKETMVARDHLAAFMEAVGDGVAQGLIFPEEGQVLGDDAAWLSESLGDDSLADPPDWAEN